MHIGQVFAMLGRAFLDRARHASDRARRERLAWNACRSFSMAWALGDSSPSVPRGLVEAAGILSGSHQGSAAWQKKDYGNKLSNEQL